MRNPSSTSSVKQSVGGGNTTTPCCSKVGMKRGPWTPEEDELLSNCIKREGQGRWRTLPNRAGLLRCGKSCRLRWMNYLRPSVKRGHIAPDEEDLILRLHRLLGNSLPIPVGLKRVGHLISLTTSCGFIAGQPCMLNRTCGAQIRWSLIAGRIPGRTDNEIKNYWNTHLSKKLISQGIDPRTHKPLLSSISQSPFTSTTTSVADPHNNKTYVVSSSKALPNSLLNMTTTTPPDLDQEPTNKNEENQEDCGSGMDLDNQYDQSGTKAKGRLMSNDDDTEGDDNEDEETNYKLCADNDAFSSFLSSLVNCEELFNGGGQQQQHDDNEPAAGNAMAFADSTASHAFAFGCAGWDAPIMASSQAAFINHEHDPVTRESENADKH